MQVMPGSSTSISMNYRSPISGLIRPARRKPGKSEAVSGAARDQYHHGNGATHVATLTLGVETTRVEGDFRYANVDAPSLLHHMLA